MQINRLFEIVYMLIEKKTVTARELSEHFEVSQRTIYRDIETLCMSGIPIYTNKGKGGGIGILPEFVLNKSLLSDEEQKEILAALQGVNALAISDTERVIGKLAALFNKNSSSWIDIDFSRWGSNEEQRNKFNTLKNSVLESKVVTFEYYNSNGEKSERIVEAIKIIFKGQDWYLYGYCRLKKDFRVFKINRMQKLVVLEEEFNREIPKDICNIINSDYKDQPVKLTVKIDKVMGHRVFDEFRDEDIRENEDGSFIVTAVIPWGQWIYGYIMSFGESIEVLEPEYLRKAIIDQHKKALKKYLFEL
ncbi:YafY family transcriptional regulator [Clostridium sp. 19966]|uniref:helix-turn-helix transcriptional regulator n=1 Tax=Clostridium sp. 19966 TaxID=2768166 RepID=UPI0028DD4A70|nr:YafY family protein [Clostridium sp. 19966]MDT8716726.1 YafY family transcriptional regulator [Clostridium sp. 19966]